MEVKRIDDCIHLRFDKIRVSPNDVTLCPICPEFNCRRPNCTNVCPLYKKGDEKMKKRECDHCGKEMEVPDDLEDYIAVFCDEKCSYAEAGC